MRIYRKCGGIESLGKDHICGFASHTRKRKERFYVSRNFSPIFFYDLVCSGPNRVGFLRRKPARADDVLQGSKVKSTYFFGSFRYGKKMRRDGINFEVGAPLR